jgi:nitroreductase
MSQPAQADQLRSAEELIKGRRTVEKYLPEKPPIDEIRAAIECARWAPNHKITEPWRFYILGEATQQKAAELVYHVTLAQKGKEDKAEKKKAKFEATPGMVVASYRRHKEPKLDQENYAAVCCGIQNFALYLWSRGIGVKWGTGAITEDSRFYELLGIDRQQETIAGLFYYGYPQATPRTRRSLTQADITHELP